MSAKAIKIYKLDNGGRVTIQKNAFGYNEIKVRVNNKTKIIGCVYEELEDIVEIVEMLLNIDSNGWKEVSGKCNRSDK